MTTHTETKKKILLTYARIITNIHENFIYSGTIVRTPSLDLQNRRSIKFTVTIDTREGQREREKEMKKNQL